MNILQLKNIIENVIGRLRDCENPEDIPVLITLSDPSVGVQASSKIQSAGMGFDWEHGQFRIYPVKKIISEEKSRSIPIPIAKYEFGGVSFNGCQKCRLKVAKDDAYCKHCGQRLL